MGFSLDSEVDEFGWCECRFIVYERSFTLPELRKAVVSHQSDSPFVAWQTVQDWDVGELIEFLEDLTAMKQ